MNRLKEEIIYDNGKFWVYQPKHNKNKFEVYQVLTTHSIRRVTTSTLEDAIFHSDRLAELNPSKYTTYRFT